MLNDREQQGLIKGFETTFELAWNTLRKLLGSRDTLREAFRLGLLSDGETWMLMMQVRNLTSHTYNRSTADEIATNIAQRYLNSSRELRSRLQQRQRTFELRSASGLLKPGQATAHRGTDVGQAVAVKLQAQALKNGRHQLGALVDPPGVDLHQGGPGSDALPGGLGRIDATHPHQRQRRAGDGAQPPQHLKGAGP